MRIALCDDEPIYTDMIEKEVIANLPQEMISRVEFFKYTSGRKLICDNLLDEYDAVFLDMNMPEMNGRDVAQCLRNSSDDVLLIFFSSEDSYIYNSFDVSPIGYIRKYNLSNDTKEVVNRMLKRYAEKEGVQFEDNKGEKITIQPSKIWYFETKGRSLKAYCKNGLTRDIKISIQKMSEILIDRGFIRIYKSYLVNYRCIYRFEKNEALLTDMSTRLPINKNRIKEIKDAYFSLL